MWDDILLGNLLWPLASHLWLAKISVGQPSISFFQYGMNSVTMIVYILWGDWCDVCRQLKRYPHILSPDPCHLYLG